MRYKCWGCYDYFERKSDEFWCVDCWPKYQRDEIVVEIHTSHGDTYGGDYAGYNNGLGMEIKNKGHWKEVIKHKGLSHIGDAGHMQEIKRNADDKKRKTSREALTKAFTQARRQHGV